MIARATTEPAVIPPMVVADRPDDFPPPLGVGVEVDVEVEVEVDVDVDVGDVED
jgi:hypothetical protein